MTAKIIPLRPELAECPVCGFPTLRPDGHAEWCGRITERTREDSLERLLSLALARPHLADHREDARPATSTPPRVVNAVDHAAKVGLRAGGPFFDGAA